jgi:hypothetical protein
LTIHHSLKNLPSPLWEGMKGRGDQKVFISSTPTLALPHRRGGNSWRKLKQSFLIFDVHTISLKIAPLMFKQPWEGAQG